MRKVTETALEHIKAAEPGLRLIDRDGKRIAIIPKYDFENDCLYELELEVTPDPKQLTKADLPELRIRTGNKFNPLGDVFKSPLGHLFRIVKPPKPDKED